MVTGTFSIVVTDASPQQQTASASFSLDVSQLTIDVTSPVPVGGTLTVTGADFDPGDYDVVLRSDPVTLGSMTVAWSLLARAQQPKVMADEGLRKLRAARDVRDAGRLVEAGEDDLEAACVAHQAKHLGERQDLRVRH